MPGVPTWSSLRRTVDNRTFRWVLLALAGIPALAGYGVETIVAPLATSFNWPLDGDVYLRAARLLAAGADPYTGVNPAWTVLQGGYVYPPLLAWTLQPLGRLTPLQAHLVMLAAGQALFLATFAVTLAAFRVRTPWRIYVYLLLFLGFEPNWEDLFLLQVNPLLAFCAALFVLAWSRRSRLGAAAVGLGVAVKLLLAPLLALPLVRRRWGELGLAAAVVAGLSLLAAPAYLPEYVTRILPVAGHGTGSIANLAPGGVAIWLTQPATFYTANQGVGLVPPLATAGVAAGVLGLTLWRLHRPAATEAGLAAEAILLVSALPLLSSLTWLNHTTLVMVAVVGCCELAWLRRDPLPAVLAAVFWLLLGPFHLLLVNAALAHRFDPAVVRSIATNTLQGGWDLALRVGALSGPVALAALWLGALRAHAATEPARERAETPLYVVAEAGSAG